MLKQCFNHGPMIWTLPLGHSVNDRLRMLHGPDGWNFKRALEIPTVWTVEHSQSVIDGMAQWESPNHWTMVEALLQHLNVVGQARAAFNYSESKSSCPPGCSVKHKHSFPQTKF